MPKYSTPNKIEIITLDASDDEVIECTDNTFGKEYAEEKCYAIRMQNIPDPCSENAIVDFFESDNNGEPVNVFLGRDGVLLKRSGTNSYQAFVLFKRKHMAKKALLKNCQPMGTSLVHITDHCVLNTMFKEFSLRPRSNLSIRAEDRKRIVLSNIPSQASESDIKNFLEPYNVLVSPRVKHYKYRIPEENYCNLTVAMISKVAAIFVVMKKNGANMNLDGVLAQIPLKMYGYSSRGEVDSAIPNLTFLIAEHNSRSSNDSENIKTVSETKTTQRSFKPERIVRRLPIYENFSVIVLKNLPPHTTKENIASLLGKPVEKPPFRIFTHVRNANSVDVQIVCPSASLAKKTVDNLRSFVIGSNQVKVCLLNVSEEM